MTVFSSRSRRPALSDCRSNFRDLGEAVRFELRQCARRRPYPVGAARGPCVTRIVVDHNGTTGVFLVNWQETSVATAGDSFLNLTGAISTEPIPSAAMSAPACGLSLHREQLDVPEERERVAMLGDTARALSATCQSL